MRSLQLSQAPWALSERDLAFAVGFMHARDRLWQLEMQRRISRGELAEILGPKALDIHKFQRTLGVQRAALADGGTDAGFKDR